MVHRRLGLSGMHGIGWEVTFVLKSADKPAQKRGGTGIPQWRGQMIGTVEETLRLVRTCEEEETQALLSQEPSIFWTNCNIKL